MLNNSRLKVLKEKEDRIDLVIEETRKQLSTIVEKPDQYRVLLEKLLLQGLLQLLEEVSLPSPGTQFFIHSLSLPIIARLLRPENGSCSTDIPY